MKPLRLSDIKTDGLNLIEASAGTGKTWTIAALYMRLLLECFLKPEEILVVTYTKAATSELKERIRHRIVSTLDMFTNQRQPLDELEEVISERCVDREAARHLLTRALFSFDNSAIFTIHGFCQRALTDNAFESGSLFDTDMITDQSSLVLEAADDFWRKFVLTESDLFVAQLVAGSYSPEKLLNRFKGHFQNIDLKIIPAAQDSDFKTTAATRQELFNRAAAIWFADSVVIRDLLLKPGLSQKSYKPQQIDKAMSAIGTWFSGAPFPTADKLSFFCADILQQKTNSGATAPQHSFFNICQDLLEACQIADNCFEQKIIALQHRLHDWLKTELPRRKRLANLRCYDDLLLDLQQALLGDKGIQMAGRLRERYKAALIDEFQDTDPLQWQIFQKMADTENYPLFLIGDPKQAIYSFRGADINAYLAAAGSVNGENRWTLETNRRSTNSLVGAVNTLFASANNPFLSKGISFLPVNSGRNPEDLLLEDGQPDNSPLRFWIYPDSDADKIDKVTLRRQAAEAVTMEISRMLGGCFQILEKGTQRVVGPGDIAVLVRTHSQAELIKQTLAAAGIRTVQYGSMTIFDTPEALDLWRLLRALADPGNTSLMREAMLGGLLCINANRLDETMRDDLLWEVWLERFRKLGITFHHGGLIAMASCLLDECEARISILSLPDGERRLTNMMHCIELVHQSMLESDTGIESCIHWLENRITGHHEDETALLRLETDDDAVRISTIHASKGLQYPVVFLPFAWDASAKQPEPVYFHDDKNNLTLDLGSEQQAENRRKCIEEQDAEAIRLLYVALTRAEFRCYVVWGAVRQAEASPLFKLLHSCSKRPFKDYNANDVIEEIQALSGNASDIYVSTMNPEAPVNRIQMPVSTSAERPVCRQFNGTISKDWHISSFSSITAGHDKQLQPRDMDAISINESLPQQVSGAGSGTLGIFDFPKGPVAGTCLHEIFEMLDFAESTADYIESVTSNCLQKNGYDKCWISVIAQMVTNLLSKPIIPGQPGFTLEKLQPGLWKTEMEFYLPVNILNSAVLKELFSGLLNHTQHSNFADSIASLRIQESRGLLLGYIDMVFEHNGRYYIIDWKSNHLGYGYETYGHQQLCEAMARHSYILQYHLYVLALDRLLAGKIASYDYETHFGGVIYIFLRGISDKSDNSGIYFDRPHAEFIRRANSSMLSDPLN